MAGPKLPPIPRTNDTARQISALTEHAEVGSGQRGDPGQRYVTVGELADAGIVKAHPVRGGGSRRVISAPESKRPSKPSGRDVFAPGDPDFGRKDYTAPPAPTHVEAHGVSREAIMVTWNPPGYTHHAYAEIFGVPQDGSFDDMMAQASGFDRARPVSNHNRHPACLGTAAGTVYVQKDIPPDASESLDDALEPSTHFYWVRFVSTAGVPGPFQTVLTGAAGHVLIDTGHVIDLMAAGVTGAPIYTNLMQLIGPDTSSIRAAGGMQRYVDHGQHVLAQSIDKIHAAVGDWGLTNETISQVTRDNKGTLNNLWSVRLQQTRGGVHYAAGFGLGISTDSATGESSSTFLVNADSFAVMGSGAQAVRLYRLERWNVQTHVASVYWNVTPGAPKIRAGDRVAITADTGANSPLSSMGTVHARVSSVSETGGGALAVIRADSAIPVTYIGAGTAAKYGLTMMGETSIPFIVDTQRNVVGVRGSLIVNGLVRADDGAFDNLSAARAFIESVTANIVNANVLVGQRIVAGIEGGGQISNDQIQTYGANYVVEMNNPVTGRSPLRYYLPRGRDGQPHVAMELTQDGSMNLGGGLSVGKNAVVRTTDRNLVAMGGTNNRGESFALWVGSRSDYEGGQPGDPRGFNEGNGILWVRGDTGRVGMNATAFLGDDPLSIPSGEGMIDVVPRRDGSLPLVYVSAMVNAAPDGEDGAAYLTALNTTLYLVPYWVGGPGARVGALRSSLRPLADPQRGFLDKHVGMYVTKYAQHRRPHGAIVVCETQYDWAYSSDIKNLALQGAVKVPPGRYKAFLGVWRTAADRGPAHAAFRGNFFAMQVTR